MASSRQLVFDILANNKASGPIKEIGDDLDRQQQQWNNWKTAGVVASGAILAGLGKFGVDSVQAYTEAQQAQQGLAYAFEQFPALADTNIGALQALNSELARKTGFDDDATASGQAVLAQFGLTGQQIAQLTPLMADYAAKTGVDMPTAADQLGKALLGQGRALKSVGIDFVDAGSTGANFDQIVAGLTTQVGGFAEEAGGTAAGQTAILKDQFGELQEMVGEKLLPALSWLTEQGLKVMDWMNEHQGIVLGLGIAVGALAAGYLVINGLIWAHGVALAAAAAGGIGPWIAASGIATAATWAWNAALAVLTSPITLVIVAIAALVAGVIWAYNNVEWFRNGVDAAFAWIKTAIGAVADWFTGTVVPAWNTAYDAVAGVVQTASDAIGAAWQWISDAAAAAWAFIDTWVLLPFKIQIAIWQRVFELASQAIGAAWEWIRNAAGTAWSWIQQNVFPPFEFAIASIRAVFEAYGQVAATVWEGIRSAIGTAWEWIRDNVFPPFELAVRAIQTTFEQVSAGIGTAWEKIKEAAAAPVRFVVNTVYNDGIRKTIQSVLDALGVSFTLPTASLSFASGGVLPGYTPGRDVHQFWSPTGGGLALSGGEGIIRPDALRALGGESWLNAVNSSRGRVQHFAEGGVWDAIGGAVSGAISFLSDPAGAIEKLIAGPIGTLSQITGSPWGQAMAAIPAKIVGGIVAKVQSLVASMFSSSTGGVYTGAIGGWRRPSSGPITSGFGPRNGGFHNGVDFGGNLPVYAANTGMVVATGNAVGYGNTGLGVRISHGGGLESYYGHADPGEILVRAGQIVAAGQHISWGGNTGNSTGQHLHFSLFQGGRAINPMVFDNGGLLNPGGLGVNLGSRPERVLTASNTASFDRLVELLGDGGLDSVRSLRGESLDGARIVLTNMGVLADTVEGRIELNRSRRAGVR